MECIGQSEQQLTLASSSKYAFVCEAVSLCGPRANCIESVLIALSERGYAAVDEGTVRIEFLIPPMTTAHRPTWAPALGGSGTREGGLGSLSKQTSVKDQAAHTKLKFR